MSWNNTVVPACSNPYPPHVCSASQDVAGAWTCVCVFSGLKYVSVCVRVLDRSCLA